MEEEIELRIFDYLEGNVSEQEAAEVLHLIETNAQWNRAFRLMKRTYLDPVVLSADEQIFPHKERLYRRERRPRVFFLYYGAAASVLLCGLAWLLWKPADSTSSPELLSRVPAATAAPENKEVTVPAEQVTSIPAGTGALRKGRVAMPVQVVSQIPDLGTSVSMPPEPALVPFTANSTRWIAALPGLANIPLPAGPLRFINGKYIPVQQRRSLLRYRLQEEGRELLAWVSEPRLMLVRTRREGARDRMELRLETKKIGIIATLTD